MVFGWAPYLCPVLYGAITILTLRKTPVLYCTISIDSSVTRHGGYLTKYRLCHGVTKGPDERLESDNPHCGNFGLNLGILSVNAKFGLSGGTPLYVPS